MGAGASKRARRAGAREPKEVRDDAITILALPEDILRLILLQIIEYAPLLRVVCQQWRRLIEAVPMGYRLTEVYAFGCWGLARSGEINLLHWALEQQRWKSGKPFSKRRAQSVLDGAAGGGQPACLQLALSWGASDTAKALCIAVGRKQLGVVKQLLALGTQPPYRTYIEAAENRSFPILHALIESRSSFPRFLPDAVVQWYAMCAVCDHANAPSAI